MCRKVRCDEKSSLFCKIMKELNKALAMCIDRVYGANFLFAPVRRTPWVEFFHMLGWVVVKY